MEKNLIVIVGPTAVGKTRLSIALAKHFQSEIISGDSMQVYKGMDIGTGKVTMKEMESIPHYMLDIKQPNEGYSVAQFQKDVEHYIDEMHSNDLLPIIVGGSGLYIQAVLYDYNFSERKRDEKITKKLEAKLADVGNDELYKELQSIDPEQASKIHPNNYRRVIRALEVYYSTGLTMTEYHAKQDKKAKYNHILIGLEMERTMLYEQINERVDQMIRDGLVNEVRELYEQGFEQCQSMQAIGYKEFIPYFKKEANLADCIEQLKQNSRRYAKRQYTWFKNKMDVNWFTVTKETFEKETNEIIRFIKGKLR